MDLRPKVMKKAEAKLQAFGRSMGNGYQTLYNDIKKYGVHPMNDAGIHGNPTKQKK